MFRQKKYYIQIYIQTEREIGRQTDKQIGTDLDTGLHWKSQAKIIHPFMHS